MFLVASEINVYTLKKIQHNNEGAKVVTHLTKRDVTHSANTFIY